MHARVLIGVGKGVPFVEVSSVQGCPYHRGFTVSEQDKLTGTREPSLPGMMGQLRMDIEVCRM